MIQKGKKLNLLLLTFILISIYAFSNNQMIITNSNKQYNNIELPEVSEITNITLIPPLGYNITITPPDFIYPNSTFSPNITITPPDFIYPNSTFSPNITITLPPDFNYTITPNITITLNITIITPPDFTYPNITFTPNFTFILPDFTYPNITITYNITLIPPPDIISPNEDELDEIVDNNSDDLEIGIIYALKVYFLIINGIILVCGSLIISVILIKKHRNPKRR